MDVTLIFQRECFVINIDILFKLIINYINMLLGGRNMYFFMCVHIFLFHTFEYIFLKLQVCKFDKRYAQIITKVCYLFFFSICTSVLFLNKLCNIVCDK